MSLRAEFDRCWPYLEPALGAPTHSKYDVWRQIYRNEAQFWPLPNAAVVFRRLVHPSGLVSCHIWLAGGDLAELVEIEPLIVAQAICKGCDRITIDGRRGWLKVLDGYREIGTRMAKDLAGL